MRIAVFYYKITADNPIGGCHLRMLRALAKEHQFTVFALEFENPDPERIEWVRVPLPIRPLALLFVNFRILAPLLYWFHLLRNRYWFPVLPHRRAPFDLVQMVESDLGLGDVSYSHFCHQGYLKRHWGRSPMGGLRGKLRWLDHRLHAWFENQTYRRVQRILVPSRGLARELAEEYPFAASKIQVLPNAVDVERLRRPGLFDRAAFRQTLGFIPTDTVFAFAALGHFERKGLPTLLTALERLSQCDAKLLVVGGEKDLVARYRERIAGTRLEQRVHFAGMQSDMKPYLWASDAFAFPSHYETFSLVAYEAAAARLPLIVPLLNGVEEIVEDGETGFVIDQSVEQLESALRRFLDLPRPLREKMGERAQLRASSYNEERFVEHWRRFYRDWAAARGAPSAGSDEVLEPTIAGRVS